MAAAAQGGRAEREAGGGHSGPDRDLRCRPVCGHSDRGAGARAGTKPDWHKGPRRDRTQPQRIRTGIEWRLDRARSRAGSGLSRSDHQASVRRDLAVRYLDDPELHISKIAWLLGFNEVSAFMDREDAQA